jgi:hypothetical protein
MSRGVCCKLTAPWCIRLRAVHAEAERRVDAKVAGLGRGADAAVGVHDDERVLLRQQRRRARLLVLARVPHDDLARLLGRHVDGERVRGLVRRAAGEDVNGRRHLRDGRVVPPKRDVVANLVVLAARQRVRRLHLDAAGRVPRVVLRPGRCGRAIAVARIPCC